MKIIGLNYIRNFFSLLLLLVFLVVSFSPYAAFANADYGVGRVRSCSAATGNIDDNLDFNPTTGGKDAEFVLSNPVCLSVIATTYAAVKLAIAVMNFECGNSGSALRLTPSPLLDSIDIAKASLKAVTGNMRCVGGVIHASETFGIAIAMLGTIYLVARDVYEESRICGADWQGPNKKQYINSASIYKAEVEAKIQSYIDMGNTEFLSMNNKTYREWYYGGKEFTDVTDGDGYCPDVMAQKVGGSYPRQKYYMRGLETGNFNCKRYLIPNGGMSKDPRDGSDMTSERLREFNNAYDCCKRRAREYACIEYGILHKFCQIGDKCAFYTGSDAVGGGLTNVANGSVEAANAFYDTGQDEVTQNTSIKDHPVTFKVKSMDNGRLACVETYSLCPYNFSIGGGSAACEYYKDGIPNSYGTYTMITPDDVQKGNCSSKSEIRNDDCTYNERAGRCKNYCQYMVHCTKTDLADYKYMSSITSPYFSTACLDFTGDSRNQISYGTGFIVGSARHFSAPMAQCVKETLENVFYNRAGHSKCYVDGEYPGYNGNCPSGTAYKKGEIVAKASFFSRLQQLLNVLVKLTLTLSIMFFGTKLLFTGKEGVKKKDLLLYIVKLGLVLYFATGTAWQDMFFDGVYGASTVLSQMVFKVQVSTIPEKRDGCQFGDITLEDGTKLNASNPYPKGKAYLAIWDTLDCKIARYLGFGPEVSTANIAMLIIAGFFTGPIGMYVAIALLFFGLVLIAATLRALHIFLSSSIAILLMVYVSPIVICCGLFEKTKGIFKSWVTNLISFCLQPMILFAYIAIFVSVMDKTLIGSAKFYGVTPSKTVACKEYCMNSLGRVVLPEESPNCARFGEKMVRPKVDSIACMVTNDNFGTWPGLELFGIGIPFLIDFFVDHTREKILTIAKAAIVMYFLCSFMDEVSGIATNLVGGATLPTNKASGNQFFKGITGFVGGAQQRANRAMKKWGVKGAVAGWKKGSGFVKKVGNKGKSTTSKKSGGSDDASSASEKGSGDSGGSSGSGTGGASDS